MKKITKKAIAGATIFVSSFGLFSCKLPVGVYGPAPANDVEEVAKQEESVVNEEKLINEDIDRAKEASGA